jgi:hypothetical protein
VNLYKHRKRVDGKRVPLWQEIVRDPYKPMLPNLPRMSNEQLVGHLIRFHDAINHTRKRVDTEDDPLIKDAFMVRTKVMRNEFRDVVAEVIRRMDCEDQP